MAEKILKFLLWIATAFVAVHVVAFLWVKLLGNIESTVIRSETQLYVQSILVTLVFTGLWFLNQRKKEDVKYSKLLIVTSAAGILFPIIFLIF